MSRAWSLGSWAGDKEVTTISLKGPLMSDVVAAGLDQRHQHNSLTTAETEKSAYQKQLQQTLFITCCHLCLLGNTPVGSSRSPAGLAGTQLHLPPQHPLQWARSSSPPGLTPAWTPLTSARSGSRLQRSRSFQKPC